MDNRILLLIMLIALLVLAGCGIYAYRMSKNNSVKIYYNKRHNDFSYLAFRFLSTFPLTRRYFLKVAKRFETMYPAEDVSVSRKVTRIFLRSAVISGAVLAVMLLLFARGDVFYTCLSIWLVLVIFTYSIESSLEKLDKTILTQLGDCFTALRHHYHETNMLDTSLMLTLNDAPAEIRLHIQKIYEMVIDTDTDEKVREYALVTPNRFLMLFAAICASIKEYGDKKMENGQSLFLINLNYLKEEMGIELVKRQRNDRLFSGLLVICLAPALLLKPIEMVMTGSIGETLSYFKGAGGMISIVVCFILSYLSYQMVLALKGEGEKSRKDHAFLDGLSRIPFIRAVLDMIENHNYSRTVRIGEQLKMTGENIGTRSFLLKRFLYAALCFVLFNFFAFSALFSQKQALLHNFATAFENSVVPNEDYRIVLAETAEQMANSYKYTTGKEYFENEEELTEKYMQTEGLSEGKARKKAHAELVAEDERNEMAQYIVDQTGMKPRYAKEVAQIVLERKQQGRDVYYRWYLLVLSMAAGVAGFYLPLLLLKYRVAVMNMAMEDEVIGFQTIILILMHEDGITMEVIMDWMERFAFCFKDSIRKCRTSLVWDMQEALQTLHDTESFPPFRRFVENLLSVDRAGLVGAFDEIVTEREYYKQKRDEDNISLCDKKAFFGKAVAFFPLIALLLGHILIPFASMALNLYKGMEGLF